jgi:hypothetical protein
MDLKEIGWKVYVIFRIVSYVATCILLLADLWLLILVCDLVSNFLGPKYFSDEKVGNQWSDNIRV